jgi:hypothetical protein
MAEILTTAPVNASFCEKSESKQTLTKMENECLGAFVGFDTRALIKPGQMVRIRWWLRHA